MKYEEMSDLELLDLYEKYVYNFQIDPEAPEEAKKAFEEAKTRGRRKKELWNKGTILG
jgi:hypothetical protein